MHNLILFSIIVFMGFFAIMNPIANTSIFIGLTQSNDVAKRKLIGFLGKGVVNVITRIMLLILAVIATQMLIGGIHGVIGMY